MSSASTAPTSPRVLLLDDDPALSESMEEVLVDESFEVHVARSINDAVRALEARDFAVVVADYLVEPTDNPWAAIERVRLAAGPTPVVLATGWRLSSSEVTSRGFAALLTKPFRAEDLLAVVGQQRVVEDISASEEARVRAYFAALDRKDWAALGASCTEDLVYHLPGDNAFSRTVRGRANFEAFSSDTFAHFPEARFEVKVILPLPRAVIARYVSRWGKPEGTAETGEGSVIFRFDGGLISEIGIRFEHALLLGQSPPRKEPPTPV